MEIISGHIKILNSDHESNCNDFKQKFCATFGLVGAADGNTVGGGDIASSLHVDAIRGDGTDETTEPDSGGTLAGTLLSILETCGWRFVDEDLDKFVIGTVVGHQKILIWQVECDNIAPTNYSSHIEKSYRLNGQPRWCWKWH